MGTAYGWLAMLLAVCIAGPYALGVRPRRRVDWIALATTVGFLVWLLGGLTSLYSR